MDKKMVADIRKTWSDKNTEELLEIWRKNDHERWSAAALEATPQILTERGIDLPQQNPEKVQNKPSLTEANAATECGSTELATSTSSTVVRLGTNEKPFTKAFVCSGVLFGVIAVILIVTGEQNVYYSLGRILPCCFLSALVTGKWARMSEKKWSWGRFVWTIIGFYLVFVFMARAGLRR